MSAATTSSNAVPEWRPSPLEIDEPGRLLAGSEAMLERLADDPTPRLRWYRSTRAAVVLGRGQRRLAGELVGDIDVVHRSSGGGAVLLAPDVLCLDVAVPRGHPWLDDGDLGSVFMQAGWRWVVALKRLGVPDPHVHRGPSTTPRATDARSSLVAAVCFASLGRGEVTVAGRKLVGLSQRRRRQGALVQCGLLRSWRPQALLTALGADPADADIAAAAIGLDDVLDQPASDESVIAAVEAAYAVTE